LETDDNRRYRMTASLANGSHATYLRATTPSVDPESIRSSQPDTADGNFSDRYWQGHSSLHLHAEKSASSVAAMSPRIGVAFPNAAWLFPLWGKPVPFREDWQDVLVQRARRIGWPSHLEQMLPPQNALHLRFALAQHELALTTPDTMGQWGEAASLVYYAARRAAHGEPEAIAQAQNVLERAHLPWRAAIVATLAKYTARSEFVRK
jgi:hypothetical protein